MKPGGDRKGGEGKGGKEKGERGEGGGEERRKEKEKNTRQDKTNTGKPCLLVLRERWTKICPSSGTTGLHFTLRFSENKLLQLKLYQIIFNFWQHPVHFVNAMPDLSSLTEITDWGR